MKLGVDLSIQDELNELSPHYFYKDKEVEPFEFFSYHSVIKVVRLRLWVNPFDKEGNPYGGGTNDINTVMRLAKKAKENDMSVLLDFHYSDFFTDPSRQILPKAWENLSFNDLKNKVYEYTKETLIRFKIEEIDIVAIQVGNEISNGMLFPFGNVWSEYSEETGGGFKGHAMLLKEGYKACKEIYPNAKRICHLEHAGSFDMQDYYFTKLIEEGVEFEVIGESYYPYWHGGFPYFKDNISRLISKYHKEIYVVEMGYEYAESKVEGHHFEYKDMEGDEFVVGNLNGRVPFPITKEGQTNYLKEFLKTCKKLGVSMVFYWEPTWILMPNNGWAKDAGQRYCGLEPVTAYNDWANETLFDFDGNANPAIDVFTQEYVDKL